MPFGFTELLVIGSLLIIFFGAKHIPTLFSSLGKSVKTFKKGLNEDDEKPMRDVEELNNPKKHS